MNTISIQTLESMNVCKRDLFASVKSTFDYALPQEWLYDFSKHCKDCNPDITYDLIASTTVWDYGTASIFGKPLFACTDVKKAYIKMMFYREYHKYGNEQIYGMQAILNEYFADYTDNKHYKALMRFIDVLSQNSDNGMIYGMINDAFNQLLNEL